MPRLHIPFEMPQPLNASRAEIQKFATDMRRDMLQEQNKNAERRSHFLSMRNAIRSLGIKIEENSAPFDIDIEVWGKNDVVFYSQHSLRPGSGQVEWLYARLLGHYMLHYVNRPTPLPEGTGLQVPSNSSLIDAQATKEAIWFAWGYLVPERSVWEDMIARHGLQHAEDMAFLNIGTPQFESLCRSYNLNKNSA